MGLYKRVELKEGAPIQYLGVYILNWPKDAMPEVGFVEAETDYVEEKTRLQKVLEEILAEARSSLPVDGMYASELHFYRAKVQRIASLATRALDSI